MNISGYLAVFRRRRPVILLVAAIFASLAALVTFVLPAKYEVKSTLMLVVPENADQIKLSAIGGQGPDPLSIIQAVIQSRPSIEYISKQTGLDTKGVVQFMNVDTDKPSNTVTISSIQEPKLAQKIVGSALFKLDELTRTLQFSEGGRQAAYLKGAIAQKESEYRKASEKLAEFQKHAKTAYDPTNPTTATAYTKALSDLQMQYGVIQNQLKVAREQAHIAASKSLDIPTALPASQLWRGKLVDLEYQLRVAQTKYGPEASAVQQLQEAIAETKKELQREIAAYLSSVNLNVDANIAQLEAQRIVLEWQLQFAKQLADKAPSEAMQAQRMITEVEMITEVLKDLRSQYETALARSEVEKVKWSVLEKPWVSDEPTNKKYVRNCLIGFLAGLMMAWIWAVWRTTD